jgi:hypothetical protein
VPSPSSPTASTTKAKRAAQQKLYTGGDVEAEMAAPKQQEEHEQAAQAREEKEREELYERSDEETERDGRE